MWTVEEDRLIRRSGWAYPATMSTVSAMLGNKHSTVECLKRYEELNFIESPVLPPELLPVPPPPRRKKALCDFYSGAHHPRQRPKHLSSGGEVSSNKMRFCGLCGLKYRGFGVWISCHACDTWFHVRCLNIKPEEHTKYYRCRSCKKMEA